MGDYSMKKLKRVLIKLILCITFLYGLNIMMSPLNIILPINIFTILLVSFLDFYAIIGLYLFLLFVY